MNVVDDGGGDCSLGSGLPPMPCDTAAAKSLMDGGTVPFLAMEMACPRTLSDWAGGGAEGRGTVSSLVVVA